VVADGDTERALRKAHALATELETELTDKYDKRR
jgi:hypothetical protein